jgi:hypothetical protein
MKKHLLIATIIFLTNLSVKAQDLITKRNGEDIKAKVIEIGLNEVKFKRFDNLDGPLIIVAKSEILIIRYENGSKEIFEDSNISSVNKIETPKDINWSRQAEIDAQKYYRGYRKHYVGTFIPCIIIGPLFGLIPAGGNSHALIKEKDMINNNPEWFNNQEYKESYTNYAKKMKRKRVWGGYLGGSLIFVGIAGIVLGSSGL